MKKIIFINFLIAISIIFFFEVSIRLLDIVELQGYDDQAFYSENGVIHSKPNNSFKVYGIRSKTDKNGFRIPINNFSYTDNKKSTLVLGDSVTFGVGIKEKNTFVGILRNSLAGSNIYNTAIFGHNIRSYLYILKKNHKQFKDEINQVIIFLCLNDIVPYQGTIFEKNKVNNNDFQNIIIKNSLAINLNIFLRERSALFVLLKGILTNPTERHYNYMRSLYDNEKNLVEFEKNVKEITDYMIKNDLNYKYVLLPYAHQVRNNCQKELLKPQEIIESIFNNQNIILKNYTYELCKSNNKNDLFIKYDPVHLSRYGHKYISDLVIADKIF